MRSNLNARRVRATAAFCLLTATSLALHISAARAWQLVQDDGTEVSADAALSVEAAATNKSATLSWTPPTRNTNGSALTNLSGYRIYSGKTRSALKARITVKNPGLSRYVVQPLASGERYFAITALNAKGVESIRSGVVDAGT